MSRLRRADGAQYSHLVRVAAALFVLLSVSLAPRSSEGQAIARETPAEVGEKSESLLASRFAIDAAAPEIAVPSDAERNASPVDFANFLMLLVEHGETATRLKNHEAAAKYYRALAIAMPERALAFERLCDAYEAASVLDKALGACADAVRRQGATVADFEHYVRLIFAQPGDLTAARLKDVDAVLLHLAAALPDSSLPAQLRCDIGVKLRDVDRLAACTSVLDAKAPKAPKTLGYDWALALFREDYAAAAQVVERAKHSSMRPDAVAAMQRQIEAEASSSRRHMGFLRSSVGRSLVLLAAAALLGGLGWLVARRVQRRASLLR